MNINKERESFTFLRMLGDKYGNRNFVEFVLKQMEKQNSKLENNKLKKEVKENKKIKDFKYKEK